MLYKGIDSGFKDIDEKQGIVTGYFAHFGSKDSDGDIIVKGAFAKTIQERGPEGSQLIKHLLDHNKQNAVGKITVLKEDNIGLYYESKAGSHTAGRDFLAMVTDGIINQHSFGFNRIPSREVKKSDGNYMHEVAMKEGSSLQFLGANPNTPIVGIKSDEDVIDYMQTLEHAIKHGKYSDETFKMLIEYSNQIHKSLIEKAPSNDTLSDNAPIELINHIKNAFKSN